MYENRSSLVILGDSGSLGQITKRHLEVSGFNVLEIPSLRDKEFINTRLPLNGERIVINASGSTPSSSAPESKCYISDNLKPLKKIHDFVKINRVDCFIHFSSWLTSTAASDDYIESKRLAEKFVLENIRPNVKECLILQLPTIWSRDYRTNSRLHKLLANRNYNNLDLGLVKNRSEEIKIMSSVDFERFLTRILKERKIPEITDYVFHGTVIDLILLLRSKSSSEKKSFKNIRITLGG